MLIISPRARVSPLADIEDSVRGSKIVIEDDVVIDAFVKIKPVGGSGDVTIGAGTYLNSGTVIYSGNGVTIGKNVLVAANTTLAPTNHEYRARDKTIFSQRFMPSKGGIVIGDDVWLGAGAVLLDGTQIGQGVVVGALSLVRGQLEPYGVYAGNPLRRNRAEDVMRATLKKVLPGEVVGLYRAVKNVVSPPPPPRYNQDGLATDHSSDFMADPRFAAAYAAGKATGAWGGNDIHWRAHVACFAAARGAALAGDFVECGVDRGGLAMTVLHYADLPRLNKRFWLLDTFQGLAETHISDEERRLGVKAGGFQECYAQVKQTFAPFPFVEIIRGTVPETLPLAKADRVAYLSIDMNCAGPEIAAVEYFWDKLTPGASVLLDDYGWAGHEVQRRAFDDLARRLGVPLLSLPTGQGLMLKP